MKDKDPIAGAVAAAAKSHPPLMEVAAQDLAALKIAQAAEFLPFDVRKASAGVSRGLGFVGWKIFIAIRGE